ncbi:MAG: histidine kinase, partial [Clostridia bacterium]|nr:histidine kinase [Clostridia bacterium]
EVQSAGMTFTWDIPPGPFVVTADRNKIKRVLDNLLSNAIKYGKPGGAIDLTAEEYEKGLVNKGKNAKGDML